MVKLARAAAVIVEALTHPSRRPGHPPAHITYLTTKKAPASRQRPGAMTREDPSDATHHA